MGLSDRIEAFINELMREDSDFAEFGRNELADIFGCVPSQINYVISTRFNPQRGYAVESRRGGGGYIRITRIKDGLKSEIIKKIGTECDFELARNAIEALFRSGELSEQSAKILLKAVDDKTIDKNDELRAKILKNVLCAL